MLFGVVSVCVFDNKYYQMQIPDFVQHMIAMTYFAIPFFNASFINLYKINKNAHIFLLVNYRNIPSMGFVLYIRITYMSEVVFSSRQLIKQAAQPVESNPWAI